MKKVITLLIKTLPLLFLLIALGANAQKAPSAISDYTFTLRNDAQTSTKVLEFDLYLLDTDITEPFQLATAQAGITVNPAIYNGGTITLSVVPGSSELLAAQVPTNVLWVQTANVIKLTPKTPPGIAGATTISTTTPGTRVCRLRITNTVAFAQAQANLTFSFTTVPYPTKIFQYDAGGVNVQAPTNAANTYSLLTNFILNALPPTAFAVTGGTSSYCQGSGGLPVGLANSELGVTYTLYKDGTAQVPTVAGTGSAITFGNQLAGTYTVSGTNGTGTTPMTGSAVFTENPAVNVSVSIVSDVNNICAGVTANFTATPVGDLTPAYQWYKNTLPVGLNQATYSVIPVNGDDIYVKVTSAIACATPTPSSNHIIMSVSTPGPASVTIAASSNPSCGTASVTFTATPVNGGAATYQWYVGATPVGTGVATYSYVPASGDAVHVVMTSSLACATGSPATSNTINMTVTTPVVVSVTSAPSANPVCAGFPVTFTATPTNGGTPAYQWYKNTLPVGAGLATYNYVPVNADQVYVVMTSSLTCTTSASATSSTTGMVVHALPVPTITGAASACVNSTGNVYSTEAGNSSYSWLVSAGGNITAGGTTNAITVTWTTTGPKTVSVNYTNANLCTAVSATVKNVTINALPVPTITGPLTPVGVGTTQVYTTEAGMTNYLWTVSAGGTPTAGGTLTSNSVTVLWNTAGAQSVSVNYTNPNLCTAAAQTVFPVTVVSIPPPAGTITGTATVCQGSTGVAYSVATVPNATGYVWTLPSGATVATGGNTNSITVNYSFTALSGNITVYGTNTFGNGAPSPNYAVTVNAAAAPTITGLATPCLNTSQVYTSQAGMTNYLWTVPAGGTITAGGTVTSNTITVLWTAVGAHTVTVNYTNGNGCTAAAPFSFAVNVLGTSTPTLSGPATACSDGGPAIYFTQGGQSNYQWVVSPGGTIIAGGTTMTQSVTVQWNALGAQFVTVNYNNAGGCAASSPALLNVSVSMTPATAGAINGPAVVCAGATGIGYDVPAIANATSYVWTLPAGATIASGAGTHAITVNYSATAVAGNVAVHGINYCGEGAVATKAITVNPLPAAAGTIAGSTTVCQGEIGVVYSIDAVADATTYEWSVPAGSNIIYGAGTASIVVDYSRVAESGIVSVFGSNDCGAGSSATLEITVKLIPETPVITFNDLTALLTSSAATGNQWYVDGAIIDGAVESTYMPTMAGEYYCIVTIDGCSSEPSNTILFTGITATATKGNFEIFPVPSNGLFTATMAWPSAETFSIRVYNSIGSLVFEKKDILVNGVTKQVVDLRPMPNGMYSVTFTSGTNNIIRKVMVNRD